MVTAKFDSRNLLALDPRAIGVSFAVPASRGNLRLGTFEVVDIQGPLTSKNEGIFDSYESIEGRVQAACLGDASTVVLRLNSPGGEVHNCFQTARDIRSMCTAAGKQLVSYIDGQGCSAAYAIASAAPTVVAAETSVVGSIGVITERQDVSEMLAREGIKVSYTTSGSKKAYGAPEIPESEAERMDSQRTINNLAAMFFTLVEQHRGIPSTQVAMLEAGTFVGQEAVNAGLVDSVGTFESLFVQSINASPSVESDPKPNEARVTFAEICDALTALAGSEDESAKQASAMLATLEAAEDKPADAPVEEPVETPEEEQKEEPAPAASDETATALAQQLEAVAAENEALKAQIEASAKAQLFAANPVSDKLRAVLEPKSLAEIEQFIEAMQAKPVIKKGLGTVKTVTGSKTAVSVSAEDKSLDRSFGLNKQEGPAVSTRGLVQTFRLVGGR